MVANVWDVQSCSSCCNCAIVPSSGCGHADILVTSGLLYNVSSSSVAGDIQGLGKLKVKHRTQYKDSRNTQIRSLYSTLVESFETVRSKPTIVLQSAKDLNISGLTNSLTPPADVLLREPTAVSSSSSGDASNKQQQLNCNEKQEGNDDDWPAPQDPVAAAHGDYSYFAQFTDVGHDLDAKRSARARSPSMSLSQGFSSVGGRAVSCTVGVVGRPMANRIRGPTGVVVAVAVAIFGLTTAALRNGLLSISKAPQKVCTKCGGYGVERCHVCQGLGRINWEGKFSRADPCPLCFGSCTKKCASCGGLRMKKGIPPGLQSPPAQKGKKG